MRASLHSIPRLLTGASLVLAAGAFAMVGCASAVLHQAAPNRVTGTWKMVHAFVVAEGRRTEAYGRKPMGMLVFTADMRYVEVLTDGETPPFASDVRGQGTDEENRRAMGSSIGMFGRYQVDAAGDFSGNVVEGATFPNWVGHIRTTDQLRLLVEGDRLLERFTRPDGTRIEIEFERVR